MKQSCNYRVR